MQEEAEEEKVEEEPQETPAVKSSEQKADEFTVPQSFEAEAKLKHSISNVEDPGDQSNLNQEDDLKPSAQEEPKEEEQEAEPEEQEVQDEDAQMEEEPSPEDEEGEKNEEEDQKSPSPKEDSHNNDME